MSNPWVHLRTTNPIESTFATVRHRTKITRGPGSRAAGLAMAFKLIESAQDHWRMVNAPHLVALVRAASRPPGHPQRAGYAARVNRVAQVLAFVGALEDGAAGGERAAFQGDGDAIQAARQPARHGEHRRRRYRPGMAGFIRAVTAACPAGGPPVTPPRSLRLGQGRSELLRVPYWRMLATAG